MKDNRKHPSHSTPIPTPKPMQKEFANQLPRDMAHKVEINPPSNDLAPWKVGLIGSMLIVIFVASVYGFWWFQDLTQSSGNVQAAQDTPGVREALAMTLTPYQPVTVTPMSEAPTNEPPTQWPTFTPTPYPTDRPQVHITERVTILEVTRVVVHTATDQPTTNTPKPTPNATATAFAITATEEAFLAKVEHSQTIRREIISWILLVFGSLVVIGSAAWYAIAMIKTAARRKLEDASGHTEAEDIDKTVSIDAHPLADILSSEQAQIRYMHAQGKSQREIEEEVYGGHGWRKHEKVKRVIDFYFPTPSPPDPPTVLE